MEARINKTSFYSKTINLERRQLIYPSVTPRYTSIREHLRSPAVFIFSLFFSPPFFSLLLLLSPSSLFSFTAHKVRVVLEHWFSTRPVPKRPISLVCHRVIYIALEEREFVRQKRARRGSPPELRYYFLPPVAPNRPAPPSTSNRRLPTVSLLERLSFVTRTLERKICKHSARSRSEDRSKVRGGGRRRSGRWEKARWEETRRGEMRWPITSSWPWLGIRNLTVGKQNT